MNFASRPVLTSIQTQLQILTAVVKLFLKKPDQSQGLVQKVLQAATSQSDNPDIRDRAYVYWRLLSSDPQITKNVVLSEKPPITTTIQSLPPALLETLIGELSTLASVYHKPPETFLGQGRFGADAMQQAAIEYVIHTVPLSPFTNIYVGSNRNSHVRTLWQLQQPQSPAGQHPKAMLRIYWILTLMAQHRHLCRNHHRAALMVSKALQVHRKELNRLLLHSPRITWTI